MAGRAKGRNARIPVALAESASGMVWGEGVGGKQVSVGTTEMWLEEVNRKVDGVLVAAETHTHAGVGMKAWEVILGVRGCVR